jgi:hypothetical protein
LALQTTKPELTSGKASLWALMRGIALLLLFTQQSWAIVICDCADESVSHHAYCHTSRGHECDSEAPETTSQPQEAEMCCHLAPQAEAQTFFITTPIFTPAEDHFQGVGTLLATAFTPAYTGVLPSSRSRPLYLTHSSLLI